MTKPNKISVIAARKMPYARNATVTMSAGSSINQKRIASEFITNGGC